MNEAYTGWYRTRFSVNPAPGADPVGPLVWSIREWLMGEYSAKACGYELDAASPSPWAKRYWTAWEHGSGRLAKAAFVSQRDKVRVVLDGAARSLPDGDGSLGRWACRIERRVVPGEPDADTGLRMLPRIWRTDIALDRHAADSPRHAHAASLTIAVSYRDDAASFGLAQPVPSPCAPGVIDAILANGRLRCSRSGVPLPLLNLTIGPDEPADADDARIDAAGLWHIVADPKRDFPVVVAGLRTSDGAPLIDRQAMTRLLYPNAMVCVPADGRAMQEVRQVFDAQVPGVSPRHNSVRVYVSQPELRRFAGMDDDETTDDDFETMRAMSHELARHPSLPGEQIDAYRDAHGDAAALLLGLVKADGERYGTISIDTIEAAESQSRESNRIPRLERQCEQHRSRADRLERRLHECQEQRGRERRRFEDETTRLRAERDGMEDERNRSADENQRLRAERTTLRKKMKTMDRDLAAERQRAGRLAQTLDHTEQAYHAALRDAELAERRVATLAASAATASAASGRGTAPDAAPDAASEAAHEPQSHDEREFMRMLLDENASLTEENRRLEEGNGELAEQKADLARRAEDLNRRVTSLMQRRDPDGQGTAERIRSLVPVDLPTTLSVNSRNLNGANDELIVRLFEALYADRIRIHEKAWRTLRDCITKPSLLWQGMYLTCTAVYDIYAGEPGQGNPGTRFRAYPSIGGFELAENEGSQTHNDLTYMRQRRIDDDGRTLVIEPHLRIGSKEDEASLRIYFAWNPDSRRIVVGAIGRHLENYTTRTRKW